MKRKTFLNILPLVALIYSSGEAQTTVPQIIHTDLRSYNIYEYPSKDSVEKSPFSQDDVSLTKITEQDINADFSNIKDLEWIQKIAVEKRVLFLGEGHYSKYIHNFCNRVLFAINEVDYYPIFFIEDQYSMTPFVNCYLAETDDVKASDFFNKYLCNFICSIDDSLLYQDIRRWNKIHPEKPIQVGFTDMEWNKKKTMNDILKPYFKKISTNGDKLDSLFNLGLSPEFLAGIKPWMDKAARANLAGNLPFITPVYIQNILTNLQATYDCTHGDFFSFRQKAMIHNLTDDKVFGKFLKNSKVLFHSGGYHAANHVIDSPGFNFLREGAYFNYDFAETKGKTYSIMLKWLTLQLGSMSTISTKKAFIGRAYEDIITRMTDAYDTGFLKADEPYFVDSTRDKFTDLIVNAAYRSGTCGLLVNSVNWDDMIKKSEGSKDLIDIVNTYKNTIGLYDQFIFVPYSPIEVTRNTE